MGTGPETIHPVPRQATSRRWRSVLAAVISLALVLSFFHSWSCDNDENPSVASIAQAIGDAAGKAPVHACLIHCDHCLTQVSPAAAPETAVTIDCFTHTYRSANLPMPETADRLTPFEPPRA